MEEFVVLIYVINIDIISRTANKSWMQTAWTINSCKLQKADKEEIL